MSNPQDAPGMDGGRIVVNVAEGLRKSEPSSPPKINVIPPAHLGNGRMPAPASISKTISRRDRLNRKRRQTLLSVWIGTGTASALLAGFITLVISNVGFEWGTAWSVATLVAALFMMIAGISSLSALVQSFSRAAVPAIDIAAADRLDQAFGRMTSMLLKPPSPEVDAGLLQQGRIVVDALTRMSSHPLGKQGREGYPPNHRTGENPLNHEDDAMEEHVERMRQSMGDLIRHAREKEDVPSTHGEVQSMIGGVAAPLRIALRRHGIRIQGLDDGRGSVPRRVVTFDDVPTVIDPVTRIENLLGRSDATDDLRRQQDRIDRIGITHLASDLAIEASALVDRHLPSLERQIAAIKAAADGDVDKETKANADRMIGIVADGFRNIANVHAAGLRDQMIDQRRFLESRDVTDPLRSSEDDRGERR